MWRGVFLPPGEGLVSNILLALDVYESFYCFCPFECVNNNIRIKEYYAMKRNQ
jgi:hypothetical protein